MQLLEGNELPMQCFRDSRCTMIFRIAMAGFSSTISITFSCMSWSSLQCLAPPRGFVITPLSCRPVDEWKLDKDVKLDSELRAQMFICLSSSDILDLDVAITSFGLVFIDVTLPSRCLCYSVAIQCNWMVNLNEHEVGRTPTLCARASSQSNFAVTALTPLLWELP